MTSRTQHLYIGRAAALALPGVAVGALMLRFPPQCPFAQHVHLPCPGCGLTRAARSFFAGDVAASFHLQPLFVPMLVVMMALAGGMVAATLATGSPGGMVEWRWGRATLAATVGVMALAIVVWGLRFAGFLGGPVPI